MGEGEQPSGGEPRAADEATLGRGSAVEERALGAAAAKIRRLASRAPLAVHAELERITLDRFHGGDPGT